MSKMLGFDFNFWKLVKFMGPGFLMGIAYLDPGNIQSDLQSGILAQYKLLWVLLLSHIIGWLLQRLALRLGVVTGRDMSEIAHEFYPKVPRIGIWLMMEIAIITCDMQEVIGTAIAFYMLSDGKIPLWAGCLITMADAFVFLLLDKFGVRKLEFFFIGLISIMAVTFGYEFFVTVPEFGKIFKGIFVPSCGNCGKDEFLQTVSIIGSIIQPYNYYLHSALVRRREINNTKKSSIREANFYFFIEAGIVLLCSFIINTFVISVFARGLYNKTNNDIRLTCDKRPGLMERDIFPYDNSTVNGNIFNSGVFLGCQFGIPAFYIWGVGIMAAGQSATMAGTYAGQYIMEGLLKITWPRWKRVLVSRSVALLPTLTIVFFTTKGMNNLTSMNNLLNCIQMIQLPFALIPLLTFSSYKQLMGDFKNSRLSETFTMVVSLAVIAISVYFTIDYVVTTVGSLWYAWVLVLIAAVLYVLFSAYLFVICLMAMNWMPRRWKEYLMKFNLYNAKYGAERELEIFTSKDIFETSSKLSIDCGYSSDNDEVKKF